MILTKDGLIKSLREVRALYPDTSFSESETFASLGWVEYVPPPITQERIAEQEAYNVQNIADQEASTTAKNNTVVQYLRDHTPVEVEAYIQTSVTDLSSAKTMLKHFGVLLCVLAKRNLR